MILSGNNFLSLNKQTGISFQASVAINNLIGTCNLGFTGMSGSTNFRFHEGHIFDQNERVVYSYQNNEYVKISGNVNNGLYSYYINEIAFCFNGITTLTGIDKFYANTESCSCDIDLKINGNRPNYQINMNNFFINEPDPIVANITNSGNNPFTIFSGEVTVPTGFYLSDWSPNVYDTGFLYLLPFPNSQDQIQNTKVYNIQLDLYTNFGKITNTFEITGSFSNAITIDLSFLNNVLFNTQSTIGLEKEGDLDIFFSLQSGTSNLNKYINIDFEYFGGKFGKFIFDLPASGYKYLNLTGFLSGSGYIDKPTNFTGSGYHAISGVNVSGNISGNVAEFFTVTGSVNKNFNLLSTGYYFDQKIVLNEDYDLNTFTLDGVVNYNSNIIKQKYNSINSFTGVSNISFGKVVKVNSGNLILISDPSKVNANSTGQVYVYTGDGKNWNLNSTYTGLSGDINFGKSISVNSTGNLISIGTNFGNQITEGSISHYSGRVYLLTGYNQNLNSALTFTGRGYFGDSLSLNNNTLVIGAYYDNSGVGSAKIYRNEDYISTEQSISLNLPSSGAFLYSSAINTSGNIMVSNAVVINGLTTTGLDYYDAVSGAAWVFTGYKNNLVQAARLTGDRKYFGTTEVAINSSGNIIYIGGCCDSGVSEFNAGAVWVFTGSGNNWIQAAKLTGEISGGRFGQSLAVNSGGNLLAVGGGGSGNKSSTIEKYSTGVIWTFTGNSTEWKFNELITKSGYTKRYSGISDGSKFGSSIAFNGTGNILVVGNPEDFGGTNGSVYILTGNPQNFSNFKVSKFLNGDSNDYLGSIVKSNFDGTVIIASSPEVFTFPVETYNPKVSIITGNGLTWDLKQDLLPYTGNNSNNYTYTFGSAIDINAIGDKIVVAGNGDDPASGCIYLFNRNADNNWGFSGFVKTEPWTTESKSIAINKIGNTIVAKNSQTSGKFSVFNIENGTNWNEKLYVSGINPMDRFGYSTDLNEQGDVVIIGAPTLNSTGSAYIYNKYYNYYELLQNLYPTGDIQITGSFGTSISLNQNGSIAAIGVPMANSNRGAVFVYSGIYDWTQFARITGENNNQNYFGNFVKINATGDQIIISSPNENTGAGVIYINTGNLINNTWLNKSKYKINKNNINNADLSGNEGFGRVFDFKNLNNKDLLYVGTDLSNRVYILNPINFSGYISSFIATGNINISRNYAMTGSITGLEYNKIFVNTFNILTGYYTGSVITGIVDFNQNNYITGDRYLRQSLIGSGINKINFKIRTKNYYDDYKMTGKLTISGFDTISGINNSVISMYITGEK
jgi:hypothetical protein